MAIEKIVDDKGILIEIANAYEDVYQFFDVLIKQGNPIIAYVIMPNHLHFLLNYTATEKTLNTIIGNGKRFMAYNIVKKLLLVNKTGLIDLLQKAVEPKDRARGKNHQVWKAGFDVKQCRTEKFLLQKLNYIHDNPIIGKWRLAINNESYVHSSCLYYYKKTQRICPVIHYDEVLDWKNMYE